METRGASPVPMINSRTDEIAATGAFWAGITDARTVASAIETRKHRDQYTLRRTTTARGATTTGRRTTTAPRGATQPAR
jgi:hypothetical protein